MGLVSRPFLVLPNEDSETLKLQLVLIMKILLQIEIKCYNKTKTGNFWNIGAVCKEES